MSIWPIIPIALAVTAVTVATSTNGEIIPRLVSKIAQGLAHLFQR